MFFRLSKFYFCFQKSQEVFKNESVKGKNLRRPGWGLFYSKGSSNILTEENKILV